MTSSLSADAYEPQPEFDTPFLNETVFEAGKVDRALQQTNADVVSPFLEVFEVDQKPPVELAARADDDPEAEFEEALETTFEEESLEPEINWERPSNIASYAVDPRDDRVASIRTAVREAIEPESLETLEEGEIDESAWRMRPPVRYQADRYICWAEAFSSWSMVTRGMRKFKKGQDAIDFFKPYGVVNTDQSLSLPKGIEKAQSVFGLAFKKLEKGDHLSGINWVPMLRHSHLIVIFKRPGATYFHFVVVFGVDRFHICFMDPELNPASPALDKVKRNRVCARLENFGAGAENFYVFWKPRSTSKEVEDYLVQSASISPASNDDPLAFPGPEAEYERFESEYSEDAYEGEYLDTEPEADGFVDEVEYQTFVQGGDEQRQPEDDMHEDDMHEDDMYESESSRRSRSRRRKSSYVSKLNTKVSDSPEAGSFYRLRKGDNLLKIAGKAYAVQPGKKRLAFAQFINRNSLNKKYWVQGKSQFVKTYFPSGIISFYPKFSCNLKDVLEARKAPSGKCYAVIWIPPLTVDHKPYLNSEAHFEMMGLTESALANQLEVSSPKDSFFSKVRDSLHVAQPFRWICLIGSYFPDPDASGRFISGFGTGILISPRHVLTAAHVLLTDYMGSGKKPTPAREIASKVVVAVGFHGKGKSNRKFMGKYDSKDQKKMKILIPDEWKASEDNKDYDFAVIDLGEDITNVAKGYWSGNQNYRITAINPVTSRKREIVSVGYPGIKMKKNIYSQWKSLGETDNVRTKKYQKRFKNLLAHDALVYKGMSGGPIWTEIKTSRGFVRNLVAINSFGQEETVEVNMKDYVKEPGSTSLTVNFTVEHDVGVAMTRNVLDRLNAWGLQV